LGIEETGGSLSHFNTLPLDILIARWVAIVWLICGLSHALFPAKWTTLLWPLRDRDTGGFILAGMSLPVGLIIILGHNIWVWDLPVIVTVAGWLATLKSGAYLLVPRAHTFVMRSSERMTGERMERGFRIVGIVMIVLGALTAYDSFCRR
jgi:uncharacterized protein YjeT (DUF2065 family)